MAEQLHALHDGQREILALVATVHEHQHHLHRDLNNGVQRLMATLQELKDQIVQIGVDAEAERVQAADRATAAATAAAAQAAEIQRLSDLIAAGGTVTAADLDAVATSLTALDTQIKGIVPDA